MEDAQRAIVANDEDALRDAIRRGADVNGMIPGRVEGTGARERLTLLSLAAYKGLPGICEVLLAEGADINMQSTGDSYFAIHEAAHNCSTACLCLLLRAGADVNARGNNGATPLHIASEAGHVDAAKVLIAAGANLEVRDGRGHTPLRCAIYFGHRELALTLLRAGAPITALPMKWIKPENEALHDYMVDIIDTGGWDAKVERHRRPLMSILSNLALPHDALLTILSFWSPPGGH